jgi:hypothetical protein
LFGIFSMGTNRVFIWTLETLKYMKISSNNLNVFHC